MSSSLVHRLAAGMHIASWCGKPQGHNKRNNAAGNLEYASKLTRRWFANTMNCACETEKLWKENLGRAMICLVTGSMFLEPWLCTRPLAARASLLASRGVGQAVMAMSSDCQKQRRIDLKALLREEAKGKRHVTGLSPKQTKISLDEALG